MRNLPIKRSQEHETIIKAVQDFWGTDEITRNIINVALWIMGRRKNVVLNEEEKDAAWCVSENLTDKNYCRSLFEAL